MTEFTAPRCDNVKRGGGNITVYIDVFVFVNMFEDFLLLSAVRYILRLDIKPYRIFLSCLLGGALSLSALLNLPLYFNITIKILTAAVMTLICFGFKSGRLFLKAAGTLSIITFLYSGALMCFYFAVRPSKMAVINGTVYFDISPPLLIILSIIIYFILILFRKMFKNRADTGLVHTIGFTVRENTIEVKCKTDSGLNVKEPFSGSSVIIVEKNIIKDFLTPDTKLRVIPFRSLGGDSVLYGFKAENLNIDKKAVREEVYIGMCENILKSEIKGLIPYSLLGELE